MDNGIFVASHFLFFFIAQAINILCGVTLSTLTAISVDRLLALLLGLRYSQVVTLKQIYVQVHRDVVCVYYRFNVASLEWTYNSLGCLH